MKMVILNSSLAMSHLGNWWYWTCHWLCHTYETGDTELLTGYVTLMKLVILNSSLAMSHLWNWWCWTCHWPCHIYETGDTELVIGHVTLTKLVILVVGYVTLPNLIYIGCACSCEASKVMKNDNYLTCFGQVDMSTKVIHTGHVLMRATHRQSKTTYIGHVLMKWTHWQSKAIYIERVPVRWTHRQNKATYIWCVLMSWTHWQSKVWTVCMFRWGEHTDKARSELNACSDEVNTLTKQGLNWMHVLMRWTHW